MTTAAPERSPSLQQHSPSAAIDVTLADVIAHIEATIETSWTLDRVREPDVPGRERRQCFFGHLFDMGPDEHTGSRLWDWFEECWSTTYAVYPVNDGTDPCYPQATPKQRILAYLRDLQSGAQLTTHESMELDSAMSEAAS